MCGITGVLGPSTETETIERMSESVRHRGPDDFGYHTFEVGPSVLSLGFRRLSIRDLSKAAAQPMTDESGRFTLIFNGEIYNQAELTRELMSKGVTHFKSSGDTEVLLRAWMEWGEETPQKLQGEFAFAMLDGRTRKLFLCRDRLGIKPLYYAIKGGRFAFASEVRAFSAAGFDDGIEPRAVDGFLAFGSVPEPLTILRGVHMQPAGTVMEVKLDSLSLRTERYWTNALLTGTSLLMEPRLEELEPLLRDAVECRLVSDVPLGVFLSGGIDSGCIVSAASRERRLNTFLLDFPEPEFSEARFAKLVADRFSTTHNQVVLTESIFRAELPKALAAFDQPSLDGMNSYFVCQAARRSGLTVALSGQGGDELFAGYPSFRWGPLASQLAHAPAFLRQALASVMGTRSKVSFLKIEEFCGSPARIEDAYGVIRSIFLASWRRRLLGRDTIPVGEWVRAAAPDLVHQEDLLNAVSGLELELYLKNTLLRDLDVLSMSQSLEVRAPFLDHRIVDWMAHVPGNFKLGGGLNKPLLLRALGRELPAESVHRRKRGFAFPWKKWLEGALSSELEESFRKAEGWEDLGIDAGAARACFHSFREGRDAVTWAQVWSLFMLQRWNQARGATAVTTTSARREGR